MKKIRYAWGKEIRFACFVNVVFVSLSSDLAEGVRPVQVS